MAFTKEQLLTEKRRRNLLKEKARRIQSPFNPEGSGFDLKTFRESGGVPDETGHMGSLDPRTGMILKGRKHPTFQKTLEEEARRGNKIIKKNGRFFSVSANRIPGTIPIQTGQPQTIRALKPGETIGRSPLFPTPLEGISRAGPFVSTARERIGGIKKGIREEGPLFIGETVGELAGTAGGPKGRIIGAGLGRGAAQGLVNFYQGITKSPNAPRTIKEAALRELKQIGIGAGTQGVSEGVVRSARRFGAALGFKSSPLKPIPDLDDLNRLARNAGIDFTPAQRTVSRSVDTIEEMVENAFFGRGGIRDIKEIAQPSGVRKLVDNMLDTFLPQAQRVGRGELGELVNDVVLGKDKAFRRAGGVFYQRVDDLTRAKIKEITVKETKKGFVRRLGKSVDVTDIIRKKVQKETGGARVDLRGLKRLGLTLQKERAKTGGLRKPIDDVIDDIITRPEFAGFKTAHNIRSDFLEQLRNITDKKSKVIGILKQASSNVDRKMQDAARRIGPEALKAWRIANAFWARGKKTFNSRIVQRVTKTLANETPDKIFDAVFRAKSPKQIKIVLDLTDPLTKKRLKFAFIDDMINKSSKQIPGDVSDLRTLIGRNFIEKFDSFGDDALNVIFTKEEKQRIRNVARVAKIAQGKPGGAGGFLIQLIQAGPIAGVAGGVVTGEPAIAKKAAKGAFLLAGFTSGMSKLIQSPKGSKILTDLMDVKPGTPQASALALRLTREMVRIRRQEKKEREQPSREQLRKFALQRF